MIVTERWRWGNQVATVAQTTGATAPTPTLKSLPGALTIIPGNEVMATKGGLRKRRSTYTLLVADSSE